MTHRPVVIGAVIGMVCVSGVARAQYSRSNVNTRRSGQTIQTNENLQPSTLPPLPIGMTIDMIIDGDRLFHGRGGCFVCHGTEGQGMPAAGDAITNFLAYIQPDWWQIDSLITNGIPDSYTRSPIAMPPRGARGDLAPDQVQRIAAYVWAISQVRGEPWPGGHASHQGLVPQGASEGTAGRRGRIHRR